MSIADSARWFVWNRASGAPRFEHDTESGAIAEAKRLASINPGQQFHVLKTVAMAERVEPVRLKRFDQPDDDIPF